MTTAKLKIQFHSYWLAGTGTARGRDVDAVCYRDREGFPAMPMTQVKGQLRETAERLAKMGSAGWSPDLVERLFGYRSAGAPEVTDRKHRTSALAFRGEARLADSARAAMGPDERTKLFRRLAATKINPLGVAEDKTLRAIEAAVPLELFGFVEVVGETPPDWELLIDAACAATTVFGKLKNDGYGRAIAEFNA